jgi:hypothetical protein
MCSINLKKYIMKYISIFLVSLLLSFNVQAEVKGRLLLDSIFLGCSEDDTEEFTVGELYEYCGCMTNSISKTLDTEELLRLGLEMLKVSEGISEKEAEEIALQKLLNNDNFTDAIVSCYVKLYD